MTIELGSNLSAMILGVAIVWGCVRMVTSMHAVKVTKINAEAFGDNKSENN